ncbi:peptidylprolyl isomerase [Erythrobacter sp. YT30]|uniref:peptidylprolyl isomerase n=1 Tax=Erythrobacter sp. YT30 TaxID=1735012 RepID=UPI00076BD065|nr:peptidylprolyl isomerase [Erythrobacter sp. YT30]KWV92399.1 peptidylprolyl isomerase [Erythrobacter sp. YT30]
MIKALLVSAAFAFCLAAPVRAQDTVSEPAPSPNEIVDAAPQSEWVRIASEDIVVMTLAPDPSGNERKVVIQLMPAPFSQGWVENIRTLARAGWYDRISVNRVQDNYVVQWGDPNHDNPEANGKAKPLPEGLNVMKEEDYTVRSSSQALAKIASRGTAYWNNFYKAERRYSKRLLPSSRYSEDNYARGVYFSIGWPLALEANTWFPIHCYGMVGVGRNYSPDTGSGAELYTVIGHAPRHLDRNIALVGRIISGMEHLSSLPRGSGALGFYTAEEKDKRVPILSIQVASDLSEAEQPRFEYLSTETESFARYAEARANRRDPFFIHPAGGADICNIPVPIRASTDASSEEG